MRQASFKIAVHRSGAARLKYRWTVHDGIGGVVATGGERTQAGARAAAAAARTELVAKFPSIEAMVKQGRESHPWRRNFKVAVVEDFKKTGIDRQTARG